MADLRKIADRGRDWDGRTVKACAEGFMVTHPYLDYWILVEDQESAEFLDGVLNEVSDTSSAMAQSDW